jgi:FeS assembly SUF system protein
MPTKEEVYEALQTCYDPEIPVNIVDLGLIYDVAINDDNVAVKMTLTAPGCGMGGIIANQAREKILELPGVKDATVDLVWDPPWDPSKMSEEAKQRLGVT